MTQPEYAYLDKQIQKKQTRAAKGYRNENEEKQKMTANRQRVCFRDNENVAGLGCGKWHNTVNILKTTKLSEL